MISSVFELIGVDSHDVGSCHVPWETLLIARSEVRVVICGTVSDVMTSLATSVATIVWR